MFGLILIEVCDANLACRPELFALENQFPGVSVLEAGCMSHCDLCCRKPYVFLNSEIVEADTPEDLLNKVVLQVKALLEVYPTES